MIDTNTFKEKLTKELALLETELSEVARKNPSNPNDWEPVETIIDEDQADENDVADNLESFADNTAVTNQLETQYNNVKDALKKIEDGTYGKCEVGGEDISEERLEANPSARTCIEHAK